MAKKTTTVKRKTANAKAARKAPASKSTPRRSKAISAASGASRGASSKPINGASKVAIEPAADTISVIANEWEAGPIPLDDLRKVKTGLSRKDLEHYRSLLTEKRAELLGDVASLQTDTKNATGGNLSNMPLHMADVGSDNYEQEFTLGLVEADRKLLAAIHEALMRMRLSIYGVCLETGKPIARLRLDAQPWAKYCIEVAREKERRGTR